MLTLLAALCLSFAPASGTSAGAKTIGAQLESVTRALGAGDAESAAKHFDLTVEVVLPGGVEDILTRDAAARELAQFFERHPPKSFAQVHGGTSAGRDGAYVIGTLTTRRGGSFRVYVYASGASGVAVQELRIEEE